MGYKQSEIWHMRKTRRCVLWAMIEERITPEEHAEWQNKSKGFLHDRLIRDERFKCLQPHDLENAISLAGRRWRDLKEARSEFVKNEMIPVAKSSRRADVYRRSHGPWDGATFGSTAHNQKILSVDEKGNLHIEGNIRIGPNPSSGTWHSYSYSASLLPREEQDVLRNRAIEIRRQLLYPNLLVQTPPEGKESNQSSIEDALGKL